MSLLHLATAEDLDKLVPMVADFHAHMQIDTTPERRQAAIVPLLEGAPHGAIWLIGPRRAPVGYIVVSFGWSIEFGGLDAMIDEIFVRPRVRGRGMGSEALNTLAKALARGGVAALHLEVDQGDDEARRFYERAKFRTRDGYALMSRVL